MGFQRLGWTSGNVLAYRLSGVIFPEDYERVLKPEIKQILKKHKQFNLIFILEQFDGASKDSLWENTKFAMQMASSMRKMAIVGDSGTDKWIHKMYKVNTAALGCRVKFYETKDIDAAYAWVSKKSKKEKKKEITKEDLLGTRKHEDRDYDDLT